MYPILLKPDKKSTTFSESGPFSQHFLLRSSAFIPKKKVEQSIPSQQPKKLEPTRNECAKTDKRGQHSSNAATSKGLTIMTYTAD